MPPAEFPVTVTVSVFEPPSAIDELVGEELVVNVARVTVKHSSGESSLEGSLRVSPW